MKKIVLENKEYEYPNCWNDVTIGHYQLIHNYIQTQLKEKEEKIKIVEEIEDLFEKINLISIYTKIPVEVLKKTPTGKLLNLLNDLTFFNSEIESKHIYEFEFKNQKYNVIQSLINQQFQDFISLENLIQHENLIDVLHLIMAVLSRKNLETLDDYDVKKRGEEFKEIPITIAHNVGVFFCDNAKRYNHISQLFFKKEEIMEMKIQELQELCNDLDGKGLLTKLRIGIIRLYIKYLRQNSKKFLRSIRV